MSDAVQLSIVKSDATPIAAASTGNDAWLAMIERAARDPAVDISKMERLFQMRSETLAREARAEYLRALSAMQAELPAAARNGRAHNDKAYARFEDIIEALRPILHKHGFSLTYRIEQDDKAMIVTGVLGHSGGHSESTSMKLPADTSGAKNAVQAWGSSASYGKRYVTLTLTGIATDDDDDGRAATNAKRKSSAQSKRDGTDSRFNTIKVAFETAPDIATLNALSREHRDEIESMPERWAELLSSAWDDRAEALRARM